MFCSLRPGVTPGVSRSTINAVNAFDAGALGSVLVRASTKYQLATPPRICLRQMFLFQNKVKLNYNANTDRLWSTFFVRSERIRRLFSQPSFWFHWHLNQRQAQWQRTPTTVTWRFGVNVLYITILLSILTATIGSSIKRPKYFFFCSWLPAAITGVC